MEFTPWYLRMVGFKKYRRRVVVPVLFGILGETEKWWYYNETERLEWEIKQ